MEIKHKDIVETAEWEALDMLHNRTDESDYQILVAAVADGIRCGIRMCGGTWEHPPMSKEDEDNILDDNLGF